MRSPGACTSGKLGAWRVTPRFTLYWALIHRPSTQTRDARANGRPSTRQIIGGSPEKARGNDLVPGEMSRGKGRFNARRKVMDKNQEAEASRQRQARRLKKIEKRRVRKLAQREAFFLRQRESLRSLGVVMPKSKGSGEGFYVSIEWRNLRYMALKLLGARCQCCGASAKDGVRIHVDHIKPRSTHPHLALCLSNVQILCDDCNFGKGNWDSTDWRCP